MTNEQGLNDFFPTPPEVTIALVREEMEKIPLDIWEPACGDGAICRTMPGRKWIATDLCDRGYGKSGVGFLMERVRLADAIITNQPWKLTYEFIMHALRLDTPYVAMLHQSQFYNSKGWQDIFDWRSPARIYTLTWRPDFMGIGSPNQKCMTSWTVWDKRHRGPTTFQSLRKP